MQGEYIIIQMQFQRFSHIIYCVFYICVPLRRIAFFMSGYFGGSAWAILSNIHRHRQKRRRGIVFLLS